MQQQELERLIRIALDNSPEALDIIADGNPVNPSLDTVAALIPFIMKYVNVDPVDIPMTAVINAIATVTVDINE